MRLPLILFLWTILGSTIFAVEGGQRSKGTSAAMHDRSGRHLKTDQWPRKADKDAYDKWGAGWEKARAEIALRVTAEVMHIVRASEDPAVIWENFRMSLG